MGKYGDKDADRNDDSHIEYSSSFSDVIAMRAPQMLVTKKPWQFDGLRQLAARQRGSRTFLSYGHGVSRIRDRTRLCDGQNQVSGIGNAW